MVISVLFFNDHFWGYRHPKERSLLLPLGAYSYYIADGLTAERHAESTCEARNPLRWPSWNFPILTPARAIGKVYGMLQGRGLTAGWGSGLSPSPTAARGKAAAAVCQWCQARGFSAVAVPHGLGQHTKANCWDLVEDACISRCRMPRRDPGTRSRVVALPSP